MERESTAALPTKMPKRLLRQAHAMLPDRDQFDRLFTYARRSTKGHGGSRVPFAFYLSRNMQRLSTRAYYGIYRQFRPEVPENRCSKFVVLVAIGGHLEQPTILGRAPSCKIGQLRVWRGRDGFDESPAGLVLKKADPVFVARSWLGNFEGSDDEEATVKRARTARARVSDHVIPVSLTNAYLSDSSQPVRTRSRRLPGPQATPDTIESSTPAAQEERFSIKAEESLLPAAIGIVTVRFVDGEGNNRREPLFNKCNTTDLLFDQAKVADLISEQGGSLVVNVRSRKIRIMVPDESDFEKLKQAIAEEVGVREDGMLRIFVRAL